MEDHTTPARLVFQFFWLSATGVNAAGLNRTIEAAIAQNQRIANAGTCEPHTFKGHGRRRKGTTDRKTEDS